MSTEALHAFLQRMVVDTRLREAIAEVAGRHGFRFTADELKLIDFVGASDRIAALPDHQTEEERSDPGFGIIEYPG